MGENLARGKPALQSSLGALAQAPTLDAAARFANNGSTTEGFCYTDRETAPWWQVDLLAPCELRAMRLHSRRSRLPRVARCRVAGSLDGERWQTLLRVTPDALGPSAVEFTFHAGQVARYVRVIAESRDYLNFTECEVFGSPREPAPAAALPAVAEGLTAISIGGFELLVPEARYGARLVEALRSGRYESHERQLAHALLDQTDRVLEVGTAIGVVTMTAASIVGPEAVTTFDANPAIIEDARRNFTHNGLHGIQANAGILACRRGRLSASTQLVFNISAEFWASRLFAEERDADIVDKVVVPVDCLEDVIAKHSATALICDIEGGEVDLLTAADLGSVRKIIMETHTRRAGVDATNAMMRKLIGEDGFNLDLGRSGQHVVALSR